MYVGQNVCSKRLYERYSRPFDISGPLSHLTKTTHKFNAPNFNWFNFAGKVVFFSRRCHPESRPVCALREPKIARSKSFLLLQLLLQLTIMIQINQNWASCGGPGTQLRIAPPKWSPFLQSLQAHWRQKRWQNLSRFGAIFHPDYGLINALQKLISSKRQC